jgi:hypothetical protein
MQTFGELCLYAVIYYLNLNLIQISVYLLRIALIWAIIAYIYGECPKADLLKPCNCVEDVISCGGNNPIDLKTIFHGLSSKLKNDQKHFKQFYLTNEAITQLPENAFEDITFEKIEIRNASKLSLIHTKAFDGTFPNLTDLHVFNTSLKNSPPNHDIFAAISSLHKIERVFVTSNLIEEIPDNAFRPINGLQTNFYDLALYNNRIKKIGYKAFTNLHNLDNLQINTNKLNHIPKNALFFTNTDLDFFELFLFEELLNSSSFESGAFDNLHRPTMIHFNYGANDKSNNITYLDQHVFETFLNKDSKNGIELNIIDCKDCRSYWLVKNPKYKSQISQLKCSTGHPISDKNNFGDCANFVY